MESCTTCQMSKFCGWANATEEQAVSGGLTPEGHQTRLDEESMKLYLNKIDEIISLDNCLFPGRLKSVAKKVKRQYGFE